MIRILIIFFILLTVVSTVLSFKPALFQALLEKNAKIKSTIENQDVKENWLSSIQSALKVKPKTGLSALHRNKTSAVRMISYHSHIHAKKQLFGLELFLKKNHFTFWKNPGRFGRPLHFDLKGSTNVENIELFWPIPYHISKDTAFINGYVEHVLFPVIITVKDPKKPLELSLEIEYTVCEKVCVLEKEKIFFSLPAEKTKGQASQTMQAFRLSKAFAKLPQDYDAFHLLDAFIEDTQTLKLLVEGKDKLKHPSLFVENPENIEFYPPQIFLENADLTQFSFYLKAKSQTLPLYGFNGIPFSFTITDGLSKGAEITVKFKGLNTLEETNVKSKIKNILSSFIPSLADSTNQPFKTTLIVIHPAWCLRCALNNWRVFNASVMQSTLDPDQIEIIWLTPDQFSEEDFKWLKKKFGLPFYIMYGPFAQNGVMLPKLLTPELMINVMDKGRTDHEK